MCKVEKKDYIVAMKNAEASVRMEDCEITPWMQEQCKKVLDGSATTAEVLKQFTAAKAAKVMK